MRENTIYSRHAANLTIRKHTVMQKLARNYNSRVLIKHPPFKPQGTSKHVYIKAEIL